MIIRHIHTGALRRLVGCSLLGACRTADLTSVDPARADALVIATVRYSNDRAGGQIYVLSPDGTRQVRVSARGEDDGSPTWSPDGRKLAFDSCDRLGCWIGVMDADGQHRMELTGAGSVIDLAPTWSPDGKRIAFERADWLLGPAILVVDLETRAITQLTARLAASQAPTWSPDGRHIAFVRTTSTAVAHASPSAFASRTRLMIPRNTAARTLEAGVPSDLWVMDADGGNARRLTRSSNTIDRPRWSPDGRRLLFASDQSGEWQVYAVDGDGSGQQRLTDHAGGARRADWAPDGGRIVFGGGVDGTSQVFVQTVGSSTSVRLTTTLGTSSDAPAWWRRSSS